MQPAQCSTSRQQASDPCSAWLNCQRMSDRTGLWAEAPCPEFTEHHSSCVLESREGFKVRRCTDTWRRFRQCAGRPAEEIEVTTRETVGPVFAMDAPQQQHEQTAGARPKPQSSCEAQFGQDGAVLSANLGQMLDEFFEYATELQRNLNGTGTQLQPSPSTETWQPANVDTQCSSSSSGIFGRWFGRRCSEQSQQQHRAKSNGPSLPQLLKEYSSNVQEI